MAIPSLNSSPKYTVQIPSTGETVRFRPFLVKEQKVLLLAYESQDKKQIIGAILDTIKSCVEGDIDVYQLATFDVDYLFTQIRAKSVGEKVDIGLKCSHCETQNNQEINLEDVKIEGKKESSVIKLTDEISIKMKYPNYEKFMKNNDIFESKTSTDIIMNIIIASIESIMTEEENVLAADESSEDLMNFVESMTAAQFQLVSDFMEEMPTMKLDVDFKCVNCGEDNTVTLQGIDDFF